ncbi:DUF4258 domain-containing protein [Candidatus Poribacteria bacterium]|nr:DUF4258 domain-containing protein [Candidatus Poribacteria bacterium]
MPAKASKLLLSFHAHEERQNEEIETFHIEEAILNGKITEDYPEDKRGPSCLILGYAHGRPLHIVCGQARNGWPFWLAYRPISVFLSTRDPKLNTRDSPPQRSWPRRTMQGCPPQLRLREGRGEIFFDFGFENDCVVLKSRLFLAHMIIN